MVIKKILLFSLLFISEICYAKNTILAIIDGNLITTNSIQEELNIDSSYDNKIRVISERIDKVLQLKKAKELKLEPSKNEVYLALLKIASDNNITIDQLKSYPEFNSLKIKITEKISTLNLQKFITKDNVTPKNDMLKKCAKESVIKDIKQIKVAQIIISEIEGEIQKNQDLAIKKFLSKLSKHISKGASFEGFAKLHSQHSSYLNGGVTGWIEVDNQIVAMLDSLKVNEVSKIYLTDFGFAIGIKLEERFVSSNLKQCKEKLIYLNAEKFYSNWVKELRNKAYIKIYHDAL